MSKGYSYIENKPPNIGVGTAEKEIKLLAKSYVPTSADDYLVDEYVTFISSKKGGGKSALAIHTNHNGGVPDSSKTIYLKPSKDSFTYVTYNSTLEKIKKKCIGENEISQRVNEMSWHLFYLVNLMLSIIDDESLIEEENRNDLNLIRKYLHTEKWIEHGGKRKLGTTITHIIQSIKVKLGVMEVDFREAGLEALIYNRGLEIAQNSLRRILARLSKPIYLLIDGLDEDLQHFGDLTGRAREDRSNYFTTFALATYNLSPHLFHENLIIKAFVPKNYIDALETLQRDKILAVTEEIRWGDDKRIRRVVLDRLRLVYNRENANTKNESEENIWRYFFGTNLIFVSKNLKITRRSFEVEPWIYLERFAITPRDYISLCRALFKYMGEKKRDNVTLEIVDSVILHHSKMRLKSLIEELKIALQEIKGFIDIFSRGKYRCQEYQAILFEAVKNANVPDKDEADRYMKILFEYGFIAAAVVEESPGKPNKTIVEEIYYELDSSTVIEESAWISINLAFAPALKLNKKHESHDIWG